MRRRRRAARAVCVAVALLLCAPSFAQLPKELSIGWEDGLKPPYLMKDSEGRATGIAVDLVTEIFRRAGIAPVHLFRPWSRCLEELRTNTISVVPNASYKAERAAYALYSKPLYETSLVLFYSLAKHPVAPRVATVEDLGKYSVLGVNGFNYDRFGGLVKVDQAALDREALMAMLRKGRGDFAAEQKEVILFMRREGKVDLEGIAWVPDPSQAVQTFHVLVSSRHPDAARIVEAIDSGMTALKADGSYQKILARYLGPSGG